MVARIPALRCLLLHPVGVQPVTPGVQHVTLSVCNPSPDDATTPTGLKVPALFC